MNLSTLEERRKRRGIKTAFKLLNRFDIISIKQFLESDNNRSSRGYNKTLNKIRIRKGVKKYFFSKTGG